METEAHADNSQEDLLSDIKCLRLELRNNREEYLALSDRADRLLSTLEAKADGDSSMPKLRIDPPKFNGDDPSCWIYKAQSYFDYFRTPEKDRLCLVALLFEHRASNWLLHQHNNNLLTSWPEFLKAVQQRFDPPRALKVTGSYSGLNVQVSICGGSMHNFIHPNMVEKFRLQVMPTNPFYVCVGTGPSSYCYEKCNESLKLSLQGHEVVVVDLFVVRTHGPDVVLGAPWLQSLGEIYRSYADHMIQFMHNDKMVTLSGVWQNDGIWKILCDS